MRMIVVALILSVSLISSTSGEEPDKWEKGDHETIRLSLTAFPDLPPNIAEDLKARGCLIPQINSYEQPHNVIRGHFKNSGQIDWAVICSTGRKSRVLIYWGGSTLSDPEAPSGGLFEDKHALQGTGENTVGFGLGIATVDAKYIEDRARWYGGELPSHLDHEGINMGIDGKASTVRYWFEGKWLALQGAD